MNKDRVRAIMSGLLPDNQLMLLIATSTGRQEKPVELEWHVTPRLVPAVDEELAQDWAAKITGGEQPPVIRLATYKLFGQKYNVLVDPIGGTLLRCYQILGQSAPIENMGTKISVPRDFIISDAEDSADRWRLTQRGLKPGRGKTLEFSDPRLKKALEDFGAFYRKGKA